jgi:hypothetical protein
MGWTEPVGRAADETRTTLACSLQCALGFVAGISCFSLR